MTPKKFAIKLMIDSATMFAGTAATNLLIDHVAIFGTDLFRYRDPNYCLDFRQYKHESRSVDARMFSSSRGLWIDQKLLADRLGAEDPLFNNYWPRARPSSVSFNVHKMNLFH